MAKNDNNKRNDPNERLEGRREFMEIAQREQIAEGDITVSETRRGDDPTPDLDDREIAEEILGEDDLVLLDEDDSSLALNDDDLQDQ